MSRFAIAVAALLVGAVIPSAAQESAMFPFVIPWDDASHNAVDVAALNPAPIDQTRRIGVKRGHFYDQTGRRVRLLGTNFTFSASFPDKADAEKVAARMHKYGFNIVRLHHMDMFKAPNGIFDRNAPGLRKLDAENLDRLDYLLYQFKLHGIYVDLNLHVSRRPTAEDGFPDADKLPELGKVVSYFEPRFIELQKEYASEILGHVNPYTHTRWADEPAVGLVEITNEDTLVGAAWGDTVRNLPPHYHNELVRQWNGWLKGKYATTAAMKRAWGGDKPLGAEMLRNRRFSDGATGWTLEQNTAPARAELTIEAPSGEGAVPAGRAAHLAIEQLGSESWHLQFHQTGLTLKPGETYTLQFAARASARRRLPVYAGLDQEPWRHVGLDSSVDIGPEWRRYTLVFTASDPVANHNRISFVLGETLGDIWLADLSLRPGVVVDLPAGCSLEAGNVPLPDQPSATATGVDYLAFLIAVEDRFAQGMRRHIHETLGCRAPVACSQASYGGLAGVRRESRLDWIDTHAYWQHPSFAPGKPWSPTEWRMPNTAMVRDANGGTLAGLAAHRVRGMPFTVSEYNHPAPLDASAEGLMEIAAFACVQDWDGFFLFDYCGSRDEFKVDRIKGFFSVDTHPGKMALMPAAARLFLRGDLKPLAAEATLGVPAGRVAEWTARSGQDVGALWRGQGMAPADMLAWRDDLQFLEGPELRLSRSGASSPQTPPPFEWIPRPADHARCLFRSAASVGAIGYLGGRSEQVGDVRFTMTPTESGFAVLAVNAADGRPIRSSRSLVLTAVGRVENTGMVWNADRTSVSDRWGHGPTLAEGIPAQVSIETDGRAATVYALSGTGARTQTVASLLKGGRLTFEIGPQYHTVWYEVAIE